VTLAKQGELPMTIVAVTGSGGAQAGAIALALEEAGIKVRRLSRSDEGGRTAVDPDSEGSLAAGLEGVGGIVFTVPQDYREGAREALAERLVRAAAPAGVSRLVGNMGGPIYALDHQVTRDLRRIRDILTSGDVPTVVLQPTTFMDNLRAPWAVETIAGGVLPYPVPAQARVSWISHRSLGMFAVAALREDVAGQVFRVGGPAPVTGEQVAEAVGRAAGRPVQFVMMPNDQMAAALNAQFGAPAGDHIAALYHYLETDPEAGAIDPGEWSALNVAPESIEAWAARHDWTAPAGAQE
jgi:uncharacterized protein YbjT (DUF2867 family)